MFSASVGQWSSQFVPPDSGGEGDGGPVHSVSVPLRVLPLPGVAQTQEHCRTVQHQTAGEETRYVERGRAVNLRIAVKQFSVVRLSVVYR